MKESLYRKLRNKLFDWLSFEPASDEVMPYDFNRLKHELRPGDVLLIQGRSRISSVIRSITQSTWTHAALYIGRAVDIEDENIANTIHQHSDAKGKTRLIVEDLLDKGTVIMPLSTYKDHHIRICRPIGITPNDTALVIQQALDSLGKPYSVRHLADLARFLLPWTILPRRWGSSLFRAPSGEPESGICSSLIAKAFESVKFPILPFVKNDDKNGMEMFERNPYLFAPRDFDYSPYFDIIKYPLFNPDEPLPYYRRLPWSRSGLMYQDNGIVSAPRRSKKVKKVDNEGTV